MRIAFSGSHRVGKSTLIERVAESLPGYDAVDEPYNLLEEDGYECAEEPSVEDFLAQLERSINANALGASVEVLVVHGDVGARARQVLLRVRALSSTS